MIDYIWNSQNKSIFHRQSQYDGDMTCVCSGQATFRTRFFGFPVDGPLARVVSIYRPLLSCPLLSDDGKQYSGQHSIVLQEILAFGHHLRRVMLAI
ncbi:hypothetical protein TNCV_712591 [Trichonephila clavipes]|nr:hypothetical protein TNCV_712591 [Trichonephila clavipes]